MSLSTVLSYFSRMGRPDVLIVCGGVIPPQDHKFLYDAGAAAIFGPGTKLPVAALKVIPRVSTFYSGHFYRWST